MTVPRHPVTVNRVPGPLDLGERDGVADVRRIVRRQARVAAFTLSVVVAVLVLLPFVLTRLSPTGVWVVLSVGVQPLWIALAVHHLWRAERAERDRRRTPG